MPGIFISYRRDDAAGYAGRLRESLERRIGRSRVFRDVDTLRPGQDFVEAINDRLASCRVMLVVIGKTWAEARDQSGARRLEDPHDFVRLEVAAALAAPNVVVVPVLVEAASMPSVATLPEDVRLLARRHAISLRDETWDADVDRLVAVINEAEHPGRSSGGAPGRSRTRLWTTLGILIGIGALAGIAVLWTGSRPQVNRDFVAASSPSPPEATSPSQPTPSTAQPSSSETPNGSAQPSPALLTVKGPIVLEYGASLPEHLKVALMWQVDRKNADTAYQATTLGTVRTGPQGREFSISIYTAPSASMCMNIQGELLSIAAIVAFDDANDDGVMQATELVGGVPDHLVTYASEGLPEALKTLRKDGEPVQTLQQLRSGLWLTRGVTPEEQGRSGGFDDLLPVSTDTVTLVIVPPGRRPHFPNWT